MLNRNDLAKQFELVVKQEIKNYQEQFNAILQQLRDLKLNIEQVHKDSLEKHALLHSFQGVIASSVEEIKKKLDASVKLNKNY